MPRGIRYAATALLVLSAVVGFWAATETWQLFRLDEYREEQGSHLLLQEPANPKELDESVVELHKREAAALGSMREPRALTLVGLSLACALTFVGARSMLRPVGLPRESVRRLLVGAALAAGVLRTVDGAQLAVVAQREGAAMARFAAALNGLPITPGLGTAFAVGMAIFQTFVIGGGFLLGSQYFRSDRVKRIVEFRDSHPE